jgi:hypothetical protein
MAGGRWLKWVKLGDVLAAGLGIIEPMLRLWTRREGRPGLSVWYDAIAARPSFQLTEPPTR